MLWIHGLQKITRKVTAHPMLIKTVYDLIKADIAVVVTPNNPTSMLIPKPDLIRLAKKLETHNCMLIIDESFLDFSENPEDISMEKEIDNFPNIAIFKSMSKAYGICGLRIGYMLTANQKLAQAVRRETHIWNINAVDILIQHIS